MQLVEVEDLWMSFSSGFFPKKAQVLKGVTFSLNEGVITGFLGSNGAGKTTTLKSLLGFLIPEKGKINFFGAGPLTRSSRAQIGFLPERPYFYEYLTGLEFLKFHSQLYSRRVGRATPGDIESLLKQVDLWEFRNSHLRTYSKGMLQKIGFAQALIHRPKLVFLDEPMSGLDPDGRMKMADLIRDVAKQGTSIFFSSHLLHDAERLCERLVILSRGQCVFQGATQELIARFPSEFVLRYQNESQTVEERFANQSSAQIKLSQVLAEGKSILEFKRDQTGLEDAFVRLALRGETS